MSVYLYAILEAPETSAVEHILPAVKTSRDLSQTRVIALGSVHLVASDILCDEIRPNRRNLTAHMRVLEAVQDVANVLPVQFGQTFGSPDALVQALEPRLPAISLELERLAGTVEMSVRVIAPREHVVAAISDAHPNLKQSYTKIAAKGSAGHFDLIELGRQIGAHVDSWRSTCEESLLAATGPLSIDRQISSPTEDTEILRGNFLLHKDQLAPFETALSQALAELPFVSTDVLQAKLVGPTPPGSFVRLDLDAAPERALGSAA